MTWQVFVLLIQFGIKHFLADFVWQYEYMVKEKGIYGATGGLHHAAFHASLTFFVLLLAGLSANPWVIPVALADGVVHYHIDWIKQQLNRGLTTADRMFWVWLGADQAAHYLTYIAIIAIITQ